MSATSPSSEFVPGVERFNEAGDVADYGEASTLSSGTGGSQQLSYAMYRLRLGGGQPGAVSIDLNLHGNDAGELSAYYLGLSNYGKGRWEWHGPYTDGRVRLGLAQPGSDFLSEFGNLFICVVAYDGASFDIIGVAADPADAADTTAPPVPTGLTATPVAGGLELRWNSVIADDLAGYQVCWSYSPFTSPGDNGVTILASLHGRTEYVLPVGQRRVVYASVSAVDTSANESKLSIQVNALPGAGSSASVVVTVDAPSGMLGEEITLSATGQVSYDWDLDGDGTYDVTGDATGTQLADTSSTGLIRPAVRAGDGTGMAVACGAVSVIVAGNSRPVASAVANPQSGDAPLAVTFTGTAEDFEDELGNLTFAWDFDGDGIYESDTDTLTPSPETYTASGIYGVKFLAMDTAGSWDVDTVPVLVNAVEPKNTAPMADVQVSPGEESGDFPHTVNFDASGSDDPDAGDSIVRYWWDLDGDGLYNGTTDDPTYTYTYPAAGAYTAKMKVEDTHGATDTATVQINVSVPGNDSPVADLAATPTSGDLPLTVAFDASGSSDTDGSIVSFEWDFENDGVYDGYGTSNTVNHTYTTAGVHTAKVRVTDDAGAQATDTVGVTVSVPGNDTPVASLVANPAGIYVPASVSLDASGSSDPDGSIILYEWDFENDGIYDCYGGIASTSYTYTLPGVHTAKVRVTDNSGAQDVSTADFTLNVYNNLDPDADISATPTSGITPFDVGFDATGSSDSDGSIVRYDWDFDGDGNYELYDGGDSPTWTYTTYGTHTAKVRVTDDDGAQDVDTLDISATTCDCVTVDTEGTVGMHSSLARVNGNPAICYYDSTNGDLKFVRAVDLDGKVWNAPVVVASGGDVGQHSSLAVVNGNPAISYYAGGSLVYIRATDTSGSTWGSPTTVDTGTVGFYTSLVVVNGNPAISYFNGSTFDLMYVRATNSNGTAWSAPVTVHGAGITGTHTSMCIVNGNPAISYLASSGSSISYARASDADGNTWGSPVAVDTGDMGGYTSLAIVDGNPAISYYDASWFTEKLKYVRASDADGTTWGAPLAVDSASNVGEYTSLAIVDGKPAISYYRNTGGNLRYVQAKDASGSTWDAPLEVDTDGSVGQYTSLEVINGWPSISYYDTTNRNLKFARMYY